MMKKEDIKLAFITRIEDFVPSFINSGARLLKVNMMRFIPV